MLSSAVIGRSRASPSSGRRATYSASSSDTKQSWRLYCWPKITNPAFPSRTAAGKPKVRQTGRISYKGTRRPLFYPKIGPKWRRPSANLSWSASAFTFCRVMFDLNSNFGAQECVLGQAGPPSAQGDQDGHHHRRHHLQRRRHPGRRHQGHRGHDCLGQELRQDPLSCQEHVVSIYITISYEFKRVLLLN